MDKFPRLTAQEAEKLLLKAGFVMVRSKGSYRIYMKDNKRMIIPFHSNKILHPKIIKQLLKMIDQDN